MADRVRIWTQVLPFVEARLEKDLVVLGMAGGRGKGYEDCEEIKDFDLFCVKWFSPDKSRGEPVTGWTLIEGHFWAP